MGEVDEQREIQRFGQGRNKKRGSRAKRLGSPCGWLSEKSKSIKPQTIQGLAQSSEKNT
jgi:hypothetical protein